MGNVLDTAAGVLLAAFIIGIAWTAIGIAGAEGPSNSGGYWAAAGIALLSGIAIIIWRLWFR